MPVLPDVLAPGLKLVFCGLAAGTASVEAGAYYAAPGNIFWPLLFEIGLIPRKLAPCDFREVTEFGFGLTLLCAEHAGDEADLPGISEAEQLAFRAKMQQYAPRVIAFTSPRAAEEYYGGAVNLGYDHCDRIAGAHTFVLPSTAAGTRRFWEPSYWQAMATYVRNLRP